MMCTRCNEREASNRIGLCNVCNPGYIIPAEDEPALLAQARIMGDAIIEGIVTPILERRDMTRQPTPATPSAEQKMVNRVRELEAALLESEAMRLRAIHERDDIIAGFLWLLDEGALKRNTERDGMSDYASRSMRFVLWLKQASMYLAHREKG